MKGIVVCFAIWLVTSQQLGLQGCSAFVYQGRLRQSGAAVRTIPRLDADEIRQSSSITSRSSGTSELYLLKRLFQRGDDNENKKESHDAKQPQQQQQQQEQQQQQQQDLPFYARASAAATTTAATTTTNQSTSTSSSDQTAIGNHQEKNTETTVSTIPATPPSPINQAEQWRKDAKRMRMEAERMEILLTLEKINLLETKIQQASKKNDQEEMTKIEQQIDQLRRKLSQPQPSKPSTPSVSKDSIAIAAETGTKTPPPSATSSSTSNTPTQSQSQPSSNALTPLTDAELQDRIEQFEAAPGFLKDIVAKAAGLKDASNVTAVVIKMHQDELELDQALQAGAKKSTSNGLFGSTTNSPLPSEQDRTEAMMESLFPKSIRERNDKGELVSPLPSQSELDTFLTRVLDNPKLFQLDANKPQPTSMGYLIRGSNRLDNGTALIDALDAQLAAKAPQLADKLTFFYLNDPTYVTEDQIMTGDRNPVILVTNSNVVGRNSPLEATKWMFARALVTAMGITTTLFYTIFPFFFNENVASKVDEVLSLASSGTSTELDWFTSLQTPLLLAMIGIILAHELGHWLAAATAKFEISLATLAPSPIFGLMSSITRLRTSPKNRSDLMDFALAGPWFGIAASTVALTIGLDLTAAATPDAAAYFPALPTSFLQASSLVASVVDSTLQNGLLQISNPATPIYLHPLAVAGYAGLMINALNLTPFGRTDGGRIALAMFGRSGAQILSLVTLISLLVAGFVGNDSFLTYFLFVSFFQGELELPLRDESDSLDVSRIVLGLVTAAFVLLTLIPV